MATIAAAPTAERQTAGRKPSGRRGNQPDQAGKLFNRLAATCVTLFALIWLIPFLWAVITSLRPNEEIAAHPTTPWSNNWNFDAYKFAWNSSPLGWWYVNSFIISTLTVIFTVVVCSMAAFALAHLKFRGKYVIFGLILAGLMVPIEALVLPQFLEFRALNLLGTYWAIIFPS